MLIINLLIGFVLTSSVFEKFKKNDEVRKRVMVAKV